MGNYFFAAKNGNHADGYLVTNNQVFAAGSGGYGRGYIPEGDFSLGRPEPVHRDDPDSMIPPGRRRSEATKVRISGVGARDAGRDHRGPLIDDPLYPGEPRFGELIHYNANRRTEGCIGYDDPAAQGQLASAINRGDTSLTVIYVKNRALARRLADHFARNETYEDFASRHPNWATGEISQTKKKTKLKRGRRSVVVGRRQRTAAEVGTDHTGGGEVAKGSQTVLLGPEFRPFGRVDDPTTDGTQVATGEPTVEVG